MTKKSVGRLERDAKKKSIETLMKDPSSDLMNWGDLDRIYTDNMSMLITANQNMADVFKIPGIINNVPDKKGTVDHIRGLAKDVRFFGEELSKINIQHKEKSGIVKDSDETVEAIKVFEGYVNWQQEYHSVIIPTITFLSEQAGLAAEIVEKEEGLLDPKVISDVAAKEITSDTTPLTNSVSPAPDDTAVTVV